MGQKQIQYELNFNLGIYFQLGQFNPFTPKISLEILL